MKILIPSRSRPNAQITADALRAARVDYTIIRTDGDATIYPEYHPQMFAPVTDIRGKRQWIMDEHPGQKILVCDDDVSFFHVVDGATSPASPDHVRRIVSSFSEALNEYAHVGIARRYMIQNQPQPSVRNRKIMHVCGFNLAMFPTPAPQYRLKVCEDIDYNMQLMAAGRPSLLITEYCHQDGPYMASGGCSDWRTKQIMHDGMVSLRDLWPNHVKLRGGPEDRHGTLATIYLAKLARDYGCQ